MNWLYRTKECGHRSICEARPDYTLTAIGNTPEEAEAACRYYVACEEKERDYFPQIIKLTESYRGDKYAEHILNRIKEICTNALDGR